MAKKKTKGMARKTRRTASKAGKDLTASGRKGAGVRGGSVSLTTPTVSKDEFLAQLRGGVATPTTSASAPSTSTSRSTPGALSS
jgi:hypothetical protein